MKSLLTLTLAVLTFSSVPATAADDVEKRARHLKELEAKVDLRKPEDTRQQHNFLLDQSGQEVLELNYKSVRPYTDGMAPVASGKERLCGFIDVQGRLIIPPTFIHASQFAEGLAWVCPRSRIKGFIDVTGKQVISDKNFFDAKSFSEGLAPVRVRTAEYQIDNGRTSGDNLPGKWQYINNSGKSVIAPQYADANSFHDGLAAVKLDRQWFFIDKVGSQVGEKYSSVGNFSDGLAPVQREGKWGYISRDGKLQIPAQFDEASDFSDGLARVKIDGLYGFIDTAGAVSIKASFKSAGKFSQQICAVQMIDGKWGYISKLGTLIVPAIYENAEAFSGGRALVVLNGLYGYIDAQGNYVVKPKYDYAFSYSNKRAIVTKKNWSHPIQRWQLMEAHLEHLNLHKDSSSPTGVYIPQNLNEALKEFDALLPAAAKGDMKLISQKDMVVYHHSLGMWIRNNWGLWKNLALARYLKSVGFTHPDDMSSALLDAYWSQMHGQPVAIAKQAAKAKEYWDKLKPVVNVSAAFPENILRTMVKTGDGRIFAFGQFVRTNQVTVLCLCDRLDALSPKLLSMLDQQQAHYSPDKVRMVAVFPEATVGGTILNLGDLKNDPLFPSAGAQRDRLKEKVGGCHRIEGTNTLFQQLAKIFNLAPLVIPQTFIVKNGVIVRRLSGFDENLEANLDAAIKECVTSSDSP